VTAPRPSTKPPAKIKGAGKTRLIPLMVEGGARPLRIYTDRAGEKGSSA